MHGFPPDGNWGSNLQRAVGFTKAPLPRALGEPDARIVLNRLFRCPIPLRAGEVPAVSTRQHGEPPPFFLTADTTNYPAFRRLAKAGIAPTRRASQIALWRIGVSGDGIMEKETKADLIED